MTVIDHTVLLGSREGLLNELDAIAVEGWEGQRARRLLVHVRVAIVHPQVVSARLTGSIAEQAEATGWEVAWEALTHARLREVDSPWGWICVAVQRAIRNEVTGARYLTTESKGRRAFAAQASTDTGTHLAPPLSLTQLVEMGWEPEEPAPTFASLGSGLEAVLEALVAAGWQEAPARAVLDGVSASVTRDASGRNLAQGWRSLATRLGAPPWQVRRVSLALLGFPGWPGVIERMNDRGAVALDDIDVRAALLATVSYSMAMPDASAAASRPTARVA